VNVLFGAVLSAVLVLVGRLLSPPGLDLAGYLLLVAAGMATGLSWRRPRLATAVVTLVLATFLIRHYPNGPVWAGGWLTLFALSASPRSNRRTAVLGAIGMIGTLGVTAVVAGEGHFAALLPLIFTGWSAAAVGGGTALRNWARIRDQQARRQVAEERLRIARDLHDSVAHGLATINVQAAAAGHVLARRPEAVADALAVIEQTSATVLDELAAMLTVLREPGPGLEGLDRLADNARAAGLDVRLMIDGPIRAIPHGPASAAYRIVQESLTNVVRHAAATGARVTVRADASHALFLEVRDDGAEIKSPGTGLGIRGMRERAEATGGRLSAGPAAAGGFVVSAQWSPRS
jgi:signal transduction histidine kinase